MKSLILGLGLSCNIPILPAISSPHSLNSVSKFDLVIASDANAGRGPLLTHFPHRISIELGIDPNAVVIMRLLVGVGSVPTTLQAALEVGLTAGVGHVGTI